MAEQPTDPNRDERPAGQEPEPATSSDEPRFKLAIFDQDEYWVDEAGTTFPLATLDRTDRKELIAWLYRHDHYFYARALARRASSAALLTPGHLPYVTFQTPREWMRDTDLMRALDNRLIARVTRWGRSLWQRLSHRRG